MSHLDEAALAALALGDGSDADAAHVAQCALCAESLSEYQRLTQSLGALDAPVALETPRASVWDAIAAETRSDEAPAAGEPVLGAGATLPAAVASQAVPDSDGRSDGRSDGNVDGNVDELAARRERRSARPSWLALAGAAAAGVVIGGVGVSVVSGSDDRSADVVASAPLSQLQTESSAGTADVEVLDDGTRVLVVETDYDQLVDAYYEVWLIDENIEGMVSLGHLTGDTTEFTLPDGFDITLFPIVDISIEPVDGVPTHSGDSVTRGILDL